MKGNVKVVSALQDALHEELIAINQYFLHAEMCENWHYDKLGDFIKKQSIDEMKHAEKLIERILFLDSTPNLTQPIQLAVGKNVKAQIESDLTLEISAVAMYNKAIQTARDEGIMHRANYSNGFSRTRKSTWTGWRRSFTRSRNLDTSVT